MRPRFKLLSWGLAVLCAAGFLLTFPIRENYARQAAMVQVVRQDAAAGLFDGESTLVNVGSPQRAILSDPSVRVKGPDEQLVYADVAKMDEKGIRPLQMQTVDFILSNARIGFAIGGLLFLALAFWLGRKSS